MNNLFRAIAWLFIGMYFAFPSLLFVFRGDKQFISGYKGWVSWCRLDTWEGVAGWSVAAIWLIVLPIYNKIQEEKGNQLTHKKA